jgi:uncharacterized RDD family membrane protein YckC
MSAAAPVPYAGIATRALALAIDAALVNLVVLIGGAVIALAGSLVGSLEFDTLERVLAAGAWAAAVATYFVFFWTATGQTPGMRIMELRVATAAGMRPGFWRSVVRLVGLVLAIVPLFAGFLPVLVDDRRRGLPDLLAGTVVLYADRPVTRWIAPERAKVREEGVRVELEGRAGDSPGT